MKPFLSLSDPVVPLQHPAALVETATRQGATLPALLENTGIIPAMLANPDSRISYAQFGILIRNALRATQNPALGIDFGHTLEMHDHGVFGLAVASSATVRSAFETGFRFHRSLVPCWHFELAIDGDRAAVRLTEAIPFGPMLAFATEAVLTGLERLAQFILGRKPPVYLVRFKYPAPPYAARYAEICDAEMQFEAERSEVVFDAGIIDESLRWSNPITATMTARLCESQLALESIPGGVLERVQTLMRSANGEYPDLARAAKALRTSTRSLRRELQRAGTSYQAQLDHARRERALSRLQGGAITSERLALELGFADVRSLRRAFKRWTGRSLAEVREELSAKR